MKPEHRIVSFLLKSPENVKFTDLKRGQPYMRVTFEIDTKLFGAALFEGWASREEWENRDTEPVFKKEMPKEWNYWIKEFERTLRDMLDPVIVAKEKDIYRLECEEFLLKSKQEKGCKYKLCVNYKPRSRNYCCNGCSYDDYDYHRLSPEIK